MVDTPKLGIRLMASNDVAKEVVFNEATVVFDTMVSRTAKSLTNTPPVTPANGDTYIVRNLAHRSLERPRQRPSRSTSTAGASTRRPRR